MTDLTLIVTRCVNCHRAVIDARGVCLLTGQKVVGKTIVAGDCPWCQARYDRRGGWRELGYQKRGTGAAGAPMLSSAPVATEPMTEAG